MPAPRSSTTVPKTLNRPASVESDGDCRHGADRQRPATSARKADEMDTQPQPRVPDSGHYEVASERGADRAAFMATLITTARLNEIDPQAWLADVLARINDHAIHRLDELLPWNWAVAMERRRVAG